MAKKIKERRPTDKLADRTALTKFLQGILETPKRKPSSVSIKKL